MEQSKQYNKLPARAKAILIRYKNNRDISELFNAILSNLDTQKTIRSKQVRLSVFRGLLRNHFNMSDEQMKLIEPTIEQKQTYHDELNAGYQNQHEDIITQDLIVSIMNTADVCNLMIRSGLRIGELLENPMKIVRSKVYFKLNKKLDSKYYSVHILGNAKKWIQSYRELKRKYKDTSLKTISDRVNLKLKSVLPSNFYKRSSHICRAIYVHYVNRFKDNNLTLPQVIQKYLNHENPTASVYYNHAVLHRDMEDFLNNDSNEQTEVSEEVSVSDIDIDIPHNDKTKRDGLTKDRMQATIEALKQAGIKITTRKLKEYGYSSGSISKFMNELK